MGRLRRARYVQHPRNAGWPNGREPQGHGVSIVVGGRESRQHGEGRQARRRLKGERVRDAQRPEPSGCRLAGELIDAETVTISSEGGGWKRTQPVLRKDTRTPAQAVPRQPPTLLPVRFGRGRLDSLGNKGLAAYLIRPGLTVARCLRLLPESVRRLTPGDFASTTRHSTTEVR
jgi:hypothetical protein